ncbi:MAG: anion permease, partial [Lewinella sp.]|nr:anion permease [Lewinella sp.]
MALAIAEGFKTSGLASWLGEQMIPLEGVSLILLLILITAVNFLAKITSYLATTAMLLPVLASLVLIRQVLDRLSEPYLNM